MNFSTFLCFKFFSIKKKSKNYKFYKIIEYTRNYVNNKLDILKYFKNFMNFKNLTKIILGKKQKKLFKKLANYKIKYQSIYKEKKIEKELTENKIEKNRIKPYTVDENKINKRLKTLIEKKIN